MPVLDPGPRVAQEHDRIARAFAGSHARQSVPEFLPPVWCAVVRDRQSAVPQHRSGGTCHRLGHPNERVQQLDRAREWDRCSCARLRQPFSAGSHRASAIQQAATDEALSSGGRRTRARAFSCALLRLAAGRLVPAHKLLASAFPQRMQRLLLHPRRFQTSPAPSAEPGRFTYAAHDLALPAFPCAFHRPWQDAHNVPVWWLRADRAQVPDTAADVFIQREKRPWRRTPAWLQTLFFSSVRPHGALSCSILPASANIEEDMSNGY